MTQPDRPAASWTASTGVIREQPAASAGPAQQQPAGGGDLNQRLWNSAALGLRLLIATTRYRRRYPLTTRALRSAFLRLLRGAWYTDYQANLLVTEAQIDRFLVDGWEYAEPRLALLVQVTGLPIDGHTVQALVDLRARMETVRNGEFDQVVSAVYRDPFYPIFQHVGQTFRNRVQGREPFVLRMLAGIDPPLRSICDVGCGCGILLGDVLQRFHQVHGYGIDVSDVMLDHARRVLEAWGVGERASFLRGDLRHVPLSGASCDAVLAMEVLEHLPNPAAGLAELARIVKPQGWLITSIPVADAAPVHLHVFRSVDEVLTLHQVAGLDVIHYQATDVAPGVPNVLVAARRRTVGPDQDG